MHRRAKTLLVLIATVGAAICSHPVLAQEATAGQNADGLAALVALEQTFIRAIEQAEGSVVSIARIRVPARHDLELDNRIPLRGFGNRALNRESPAGHDFIPNDFGAGLIIAPKENPANRLILTNYHVVKGGRVDNQPADGKTRLYARFPGQRGCDLTILAADPRSDLAVLKIDFEKLGVSPADLKPIRMNAEANFRKGQIVLTLGNPYAIARDGSASASWGMISNIDRRPAPIGPPQDEEMFRKPTLHHFGTLLQIDNRLDLGSSGGAVLNLQGELIGIATSLAALEGYEKSVGYAVPLDATTTRIIDSLTRGHEVEYGFLGVYPTDINREALRRQGLDATFEQISAARIESVNDQSPAHRGGLLPGDVVLKVNGRPIFSADDLIRDIGQLGPGATAQLQVWRHNKRQELNLGVELGKWPVYDDEGIIATASRFGQWRGLTVDYSTARFKYLPQGTFQQFQAVLVTQIAPQTSAARSDLKEGDFITHVNDTPVASPADFQRAVRGLSGDVKLVLVGRPPVVVSQ